MVSRHPTPFSDVNDVLTILLAQVQEILGTQFVGMYLYGSLSSGDFHSEASDIDFLVVTEDSLSDEIIASLKSMHDRIWETALKWAHKLEGSYIPKTPLRHYEKSDISYPTVNEHKFYVAPHGSDWIIQRHIIREHGIVLAGPNPKTLIAPVSPDEIRHAVRSTLHEWWFPMLDDPSWLRDRGSPYHAYAILTMCRSLYALKYGTIVSKPLAARWAQDELGGKWSKVIEQSLTTRMGAREFDLYDNALELIRYTMDKTSTFEKKT